MSPPSERPSLVSLSKILHLAHPQYSVSHLTLLYFLAQHLWLPEFIFYGYSFLHYLSSPLESKFPVGKGFVYLVDRCTWLLWTCLVHSRCSNICSMLHVERTLPREVKENFREEMTIELGPERWWNAHILISLPAGQPPLPWMNACGESSPLPSTILANLLHALPWSRSETWDREGGVCVGFELFLFL